MRVGLSRVDSVKDHITSILTPVSADSKPSIDAAPVSKLESTKVTHEISHPKSELAEVATASSNVHSHKMIDLTDDQPPASMEEEDDSVWRQGKDVTQSDALDVEEDVMSYE